MLNLFSGVWHYSNPQKDRTAKSYLNSDELLFYLGDSKLVVESQVNLQIFAHYSGHASYTKGLLLKDSTGLGDRRGNALELTSRDCRRVFFVAGKSPLGTWAHGHMAKSISAILREKSNFDGVYHSFPHKNGRIFCIFPFWEKPMVVPHERCVLVQVAYQEFRLLAGCGGTQANDPA